MIPAHGALTGGYDGPPPLSGSRYLTERHAEPVVVVGLVVTAGL
jgi:hypothetical protein